MSSQIVLSVPRMMCNGCVSTIENALKDKADVAGIEADLDAKTVKLETDVPVAEVVSIIKLAGYDAEQIE